MAAPITVDVDGPWGVAANLGTLTFHTWPVRSGDLGRPDELRVDLDPQPGTGFREAVAAALAPQDLTVRTVPARFADVGDVHAHASAARSSLAPLRALADTLGVTLEDTRRR